MATSTPWGSSQSSHKYATGIVLYSTASHGGFHLSARRQAEMIGKFPEFKTFLGKPEWYEEDYDACVVVAAFKEFFSDEMVKQAFHCMKNNKYFVACRTSPYWQELESKFAA